MFYLQPPRHTSTLPICDMAAMAINVRLLEQSGLIVREVAHLPKVL